MIRKIILDKVTEILSLSTVGDFWGTGHGYTTGLWTRKENYLHLVDNLGHEHFFYDHDIVFGLVSDDCDPPLLSHSHSFLFFQFVFIDLDRIIRWQKGKTNEI